MQKCWTLDPDERPTPIDIVGALTPLDGSLQGGNTDGKTPAEENSEPSPVKANGNHHFSEFGWSVASTYMYSRGQKHLVTILLYVSTLCTIMCSTFDALVHFCILKLNRGTIT